MKPNFRVARRWLHWLTVGASGLVIGLCLLLFVQWPLRDWIQAYSRQANYIGQIIFSLYAAVAIAAASVTNSHLAISHPHKGAVKGKVPWRNWAPFLCVGILLQRLTVADTLFSSIARMSDWTGAGTSVAALGVGVLVSPMNGSVASSSAMMARLVAPRLGRLNSASATALISVSSTIGVVVPPSLVLILLGNAMMSAHTEASNFPGFRLGEQRIINTQDVFHAALLPASLVLAMWLLIAWWQGRGMPSERSQAPLTVRHWMLSAAVFFATLLLLRQRALRSSLTVTLATHRRKITSQPRSCAFCCNRASGLTATARLTDSSKGRSLMESL